MTRSPTDLCRTSVPIASTSPWAGLTVVRGSLDDRAVMAKAFAGSDAVISAIGVALRAKKPIDLMQRTLPVVTAAAQDAGVERFVLVSAFGVGDTAAKASFLGRLVYKTVVAAIFKDKELSEESLPASGLNWTIVHPVNLQEAPAASAATVKRLDRVAKVPGLPTLPFVNVARALVEIADDRGLAGQRVLVTTEKGWKPQGARGLRGAFVGRCARPGTCGITAILKTYACVPGEAPPSGTAGLPLKPVLSIWSMKAWSVA